MCPDTTSLHHLGRATMPDYSHETTREMMCRKLLEYGRIADQKAKLADQIVELAELLLCQN